MNAKKIAVALIVIGAVALLPASAAQAAAPVWGLSVTAFPTSFIAGASGNAADGPLYRLRAKNEGDAPTAGVYSLTATFSEEISPGAEISGKDGKGAPLSCEATDQTVTCTGTEAVAHDEEVEVTIPVDVASGATGRRAHVEAQVQGGAAALVSQSLDTGIGRPAWGITATPLPTHFLPGSEGDEILLIATNVGAASTSGQITFTDTLPAGLTPTGADIAASGNVASGSCEVTDQMVTCVTLKSLGSGRQLAIAIKVDVENLADGTVLPDQATIAGAGAGVAVADTTTTIDSSPPPFGFLSGFNGFTAPLSEADGGPATQAGAHPNQLTVNLGFPTHKHGKILGGAGYLRDSIVDLPPGTIVNPSATPVLCTEAELFTETDPGCPPASQIGTITIITFTVTGSEATTSPVFNMVPPHGTASNFGFDAAGIGVFTHIIGAVRSDGDYGLSGVGRDLDALTFHPIFGIRLDLWGDPSNPSHDEVRGDCAFGGCGGSSLGLSSETAFITAPTECSGQPTTTIAHVDSWEHSGVFSEAKYQSADLAGNLVSVTGCNQLEFKPTIQVVPTTNLIDSPSGLDVDLHQLQNEEPSGHSTAALKNATVTLPVGMSVNPSQADGLGSCDTGQIGLTTSVGETPIHFSKTPDSCTDAAKLGTVEVTSPLLAQTDESGTKVLHDPEGDVIPRPLHGSVYLAKPFVNPFGSLLAIYLSIEDPQTGIVAKLAGKVIPDPQTGQLTTRFEENPQLPLEDVKLHLFGGARGALITPPVCGVHTTTSDLTPWSTPEGLDAHPESSFEATAAPGGGSCPRSEGAATNAPAFSAGTIAPAAGAYSPFVLKLSREDGSQRLVGIDTTLPKGLTGKLAGVPYCPEAQIALAKSREAPNQGATEQSSPSCPTATEVGTVDVAAGAGPNPYHVQGHVYLAGPYKSAPLSLAIITPAVAGPFDLGTVVVRTALYVDPASARIHAVSDPFPTILDGIPLDLRSVAVKLDRPSFTLNPTSCDPMKVIGSVTSTLGQAAALTSPFQVGGCKALAFKPKLAIKLNGGTKRSKNPALRAVLTMPPGGANIASTSVALPHSEFLDQSHIRTICTRVQFAEGGGNGAGCPPGSVYGRARAITPLLDEPLEGPVYLRANGGERNLPDLVAALHGKIEVELIGYIDSANGGIRTSFEAVPDAPVSKFVLEMQGGKKGLLENSTNLCKSVNRATVHFEGQNGKVYDSQPELKSSCKKHRKTHLRHAPR